MPDNVRSIFESLDVNGSGFIELDELADMAANFGLAAEDLLMRLDVDGDGKISLSDFVACAASLGLAPAPTDDGAAARMAQAEAAAHGATSSDTLAAKAAILFDQLDVDHSGTIDEDEVEQILIGMGLKDPALRARQVALLMTKLDTDGNGEVSRDEFVSAAADPAFAAIFGASRLPLSAPPSLPLTSRVRSSSSSFPAVSKITSSCTWRRGPLGMLAGRPVVVINPRSRCCRPREKERDALAERADALFAQLDQDQSGAIGLPELDALLLRLGLADASERRQRAQALSASRRRFSDTHTHSRSRMAASPACHVSLLTRCACALVRSDGAGRGHERRD